MATTSATPPAIRGVRLVPIELELGLKPVLILKIFPRIDSFLPQAAQGNCTGGKSLSGIASILREKVRGAPFM